ncbi:hypothetical protein M0R45_025875 [Rubus argutus]|uniref:Uncharacterized protein n=1 Tax=Rubus argutus TaxID=59490 RepID=A0AAW1WZH5_RUBAR
MRRGMVARWTLWAAHGEDTERRLGPWGLRPEHGLMVDLCLWLLNDLFEGGSPRQRRCCLGEGLRGLEATGWLVRGDEGRGQGNGHGLIGLMRGCCDD